MNWYVTVPQKPLKSKIPANHLIQTATVYHSTLIPPFWIDPSTYCFSSVRISVNLACEPHFPGEADGVRNYTVATWMGGEEVDEQGVTLIFPDFGEGWRTTGNRSRGIAPVYPGHRVGVEPYDGEWYMLEFYLPILDMEMNLGREMSLEGDKTLEEGTNVEREVNSEVATTVEGIMGDDSAVVLDAET